MTTAAAETRAQAKRRKEEEAEGEAAAATQNGHDPEVVLDLDEVISDRPMVALKGKRYELRAPQEFGIEEEHEFRAKTTEFNDLQRMTDSAESLTKTQKAALRSCLDYLFNTVIIAEPDERKLFNDKARQQVLGRFTVALRTEEGAALEAMATPEIKELIKQAREVTQTTET